MILVEFIFQSFWHFVGTAILLAIVTAPLHTFFATLAALIGGRK